MSRRFKAAIFFCVILSLMKPITCYIGLNPNGEDIKFVDFEAQGQPSEITDSLSELSVEDLKALDELMDALSEHDIQMIKNNGEEGQPRYKREDSQIIATDERDIQFPDVDEEYIKQLDESFPNLDEQSNQDDKENVHVRVKRN